MDTSGLAVVILAAGQGTRMKSALPKVMHRLAGRPMLAHVLSVAKALGADRTVAVISPGAEDVAALARAHHAEAAVQDRQLGTGHAVLCAEPALKGFEGTILVLFGDTPLLTPPTLAALAAQLGAGADVAALGFRAPDPTGYGRMIVTGGALERIVEHKDASTEERRVDLCFAGMLAAKAPLLFDLLHNVGNANAQGEFYLTDVIGLARARGLVCATVEGPVDEMLGVNTRAHLAEAEATIQRRLRRSAMDGGVTFTDPDTVYLCADTLLEPDVSLGPFVVFGPGAVVKRGAEVRAFSHIEGATVGEGAIVGPFARLRPGAVLEENVHVGNFVEVKNARLGKGAKANHLTYLGDASVGAAANIGAGTITCNYDGTGKHHTDIGTGAFIGSHTTLVAPVRIGDGAYTAAGSVVTLDVDADALALGRARQVTKPGMAKVLRDRFKAKKERG